ncbi:tyrosine-type recombinase/integrase [Lysinibacillus sp. NPDC048646]|uniref:tyrosine-type recombinase/integrase n=1 Tax=Lysinibacillus sp. NPDC048646 TaxID=3390574 RepID=UPI003D080E5F
MASYKELAPSKNGNPRIKITVELGYDEETGKRIRKYKTVTLSSLTDRAIKKAITEFEIEVSKVDITLTTEHITFKEFCNSWMDNYARVDLSPATKSHYLRILKPGTFEKFDNMKIKKIKKFHIVEYFSEEKKEERKNLGNKYNVLKSIFSKASEWELIKENPMAGVKEPYVEPRQKTLQFYDANQLSIMLEAIKSLNLKYRVIYKLAALVGLRESEIAAIRLEKINFVNNTILIDQALKYDTEEKSVLVLGNTKNKQARIVNVPQKFMDEIKEQVIAQKKLKIKSGEAWKPMKDDTDDDIDFLITSQRYLGYPITPSSISTMWRRQSTKLKLPNINFHALRHSCASYLLSNNTNFKIIQEQLSHNNVGMTINTYSH